jgi:NADH-quinone oxidoreductase subunit L
VTHEIAERGGHALELLLMSGTTAVAVLGFLLAWLLYYRRPELPDRIAGAAGMVYRFVLNKYYVDELYQTVFVKPLIEGSTKLLWHGIDTETIDNAINGSAHGAQELSDTVRHMQSGNIRSYAGWVTLGAALLVAYVIWMGVR